jgi:hypothetical protein
MTCANTLRLANMAWGLVVVTLEWRHDGQLPDCEAGFSISIGG